LPKEGDSFLASLVHGHPFGRLQPKDGVFDNERAEFSFSEKLLVTYHERPIRRRHGGRERALRDHPIAKAQTRSHQCWNSIVENYKPALDDSP